MDSVKHVDRSSVVGTGGRREHLYSISAGKAVKVTQEPHLLLQHFTAG